MKLISILGVCVALLPFLGIPLVLKTWVFFLLGIAIFVKSFLMNKGFEQLVGDSFSQNGPDDILVNIENDSRENK